MPERKFLTLPGPLQICDIWFRKLIKLHVLILLTVAGFPISPTWAALKKVHESLPTWVLYMLQEPTKVGSRPMDHNHPMDQSSKGWWQGMVDSTSSWDECNKKTSQKATTRQQQVVFLLSLGGKVHEHHSTLKAIYLKSIFLIIHTRYHRLSSLGPHQPPTIVTSFR